MNEPGSSKDDNPVDPMDIIEYTPVVEICLNGMAELPSDDAIIPQPKVR